MFVKKGDKVRVIAGKDKGVEAVVLTALPKVNKVVVEGVNVQVLDKNGVAGRVGYKFVDGKKVRYNKKSGEVLD